MVVMRKFRCHSQVEDDRALLMTYGAKLNEVLQTRANALITTEKKKGEFEISSIVATAFVCTCLAPYKFIFTTR